MTLLAIDIGNTRLKWTLYEKASPDAKILANGAEFLENIDKLAEGQWAKIPEPSHIIGCCVAAKSARNTAAEQMEIWKAEPYWVYAGEALARIKNGYEFPTRLGTDRWVAMIGARHHMLKNLPAGQLPKPILLTMIGTAATVEAIDEEGNFLGGLILPGHGIMLKALQAGTAGLHVPTGNVCEFPRNTSDALTSGGTYAIAGACERMYQHLKAKCGQDPVCMMTGGAGWKMLPSMTRKFELIESMIFDGLLVIAQDKFKTNKNSD